VVSDTIGARYHPITAPQISHDGTLERVIGPVHMAPVPIPYDCTDGFLCSYWRRPEAYLDDEVRRGMSSFARIDAEAGLARLRADLASGRWAERNRHLLALETLDVGYRIVRCELDGNVTGDPAI
jgi:hypothetical protein